MLSLFGQLETIRHLSFGEKPLPQFSSHFSPLHLLVCWNLKPTTCVFSQGAVSGVLLVTPNNIMFDPHRMDPLVQAHGCEEYGIMCPLEEVQSAAIFKEITDPKIRDTVPE